jgi:hypothetical protein
MLGRCFFFAVNMVVAYIFLFFFSAFSFVLKMPSAGACQYLLA